jgi:RNA 3'-phosphate cyclase
MGLLTWYRLTRAGYYPIGGGEIQAEVRPVGSLRAVRFADRPPGTVTCFSAVSNLPRSIAERQMAEVLACLEGLGVEAGQVIEDYESPGKGTVVFILYDGDVKAGFTALGERGKPAERVAREACDEFAAWWRSGMALDKHLADQLIVPMALAAGESSFTTVENTLHLGTNIHTVRQFLSVEFEVQGEEGGPGTVRVAGAAYEQ